MSLRFFALTAFTMILAFPVLAETVTTLDSAGNVNGSWEINNCYGSFPSTPLTTADYRPVYIEVSDRNEPTKTTKQLAGICPRTLDTNTFAVKGSGDDVPGSFQTTIKYLIGIDTKPNYSNGWSRQKGESPDQKHLHISYRTICTYRPLQQQAATFLGGGSFSDSSLCSVQPKN